MPEVKKPLVLHIGERTYRVVVWLRDQRVVTIDGRLLARTPDQARRLARWLTEYAAWAASIEQAEEKAKAERDERNE